MPSVRTRLLDIAYKDEGSSDAPVILMLHGWPDDYSTWDRVGPALNEAGLRSIVPSYRGFGPTRFLSPGTLRTGDPARLAQDAVDLLDTLGIRRFSVAGHDWGSNTASALAVGWPDRVDRLALLSSPPRFGELSIPPLFWARLQWYHWFQATKVGAQAVREDPRGFARIMWETWSPAGWFTDTDFDRVAASFDNGDWVDVTLHSYRSRWGEAEVDPATAWLADKVRATRSLALPTLYIQGERDGVNPPVVSEAVGQWFTGAFQRIVLPGVGHFPTHEAPAEVATQLVAHFTPLLSSRR